MKWSSPLILISGVASQSSAFCPQSTQFASKSTTALKANRRQFIEGAIAASIVLVEPNVALAEPRPTYLTEPTAEFKENEAKAAEFKRQQLMIKKEMITALEKLTAESNDSDALVKDLNDIQGIIAKTGGLPLGVKKDDLVKTIRSKKAKGFWPTPVEVA